MAEVLRDTTFETTNDAAADVAVESGEATTVSGLDPPWANEPLLSDDVPNTTETLPIDGQEPEISAAPDEPSKELEGQLVHATEGETAETTDIQDDIQAIQQFNGQHQMQYSQMTPHGPQPYYHDPMMHAQYHHPHPQSGYMNQIPNPPGTKAKRKRASPHQLALLNQIFEYTFFPSTELRNAIGKELGMAPRTVQIWFQNRRQAWRSTKVINADGTESSTAKSNDNERGGWEVLRSFQARRANGEIQEYEYMAIPSPSSLANGQDGRVVGGYSLVPYHAGMMQVALSSNDQFNSSMQQVPMPLPHTPRPNANLVMGPPHPQHLQQQQQVPPPTQSIPTPSAGEQGLDSNLEINNARNGKSPADATASTTPDATTLMSGTTGEGVAVPDNVDPTLENLQESLPSATTTTEEKVDERQVDKHADIPDT